MNIFNRDINYKTANEFVEVEEDGTINEQYGDDPKYLLYIEPATIQINDQRDVEYATPLETEEILKGLK
jgi:hypothetical protein